jgi:hypothetical protein
VTTLVVAAVVPVLAAVDADPAVTACVAAAVVVLEGIQQVFQFQAHWITYRATAETLRRHAFLWAAEVEPYDAPDTRRGELARVISDTAAKENAEWATAVRSTLPAQERTGPADHE